MIHYTLWQRLLRAILLGISLGTVLLVTAEGAYTEFYCQSGGSNLNAGSTTNDTAPYISASGNWNGSTVFTVQDGTNPSSSVTIGDFVSVYANGATSTGFIARVTAVQNATNGTITVSSSAKAGSAPSSGTGTRTLNRGGAWKGPNAADVSVPLNLATLGSATDSSSNRVRVNLKNTTSYTVSSSVTTGSSVTDVTIQGYGSSVGDGGKATIDGSTNAIVPLNIGGANNVQLIDLIISSSASSGTNNALTWGAFTGQIIRCVVHGARGDGINFSGTGSIVESEVYGNNTSNTSARSGITVTSASSGQGCTIDYTYVHDNTGSNTAGILYNTAGNSNTGITLHNCIIEGNGMDGFQNVGGILVQIFNCDFYNNAGDAVHNNATNGVVFHLQNNNYIKNSGKALNITGNKSGGFSYNDGYGAGTQANGSADVLDGITQSGKITYASNVTPWVDPANGDFSINLATAQGTGRGHFEENDGSNTGSVGYPDVGAVQAQLGQAFPTPTSTPTATATASATSTATATATSTATPTATATPVFTPCAPTPTATATATPTATATVTATATATATVTPTATAPEMSYGFPH